MKNYYDPTQPEMHAAAPCPHCGNDDVDTLQWDNPTDDFKVADQTVMWDAVTCVRCGARYWPMNPERGYILPS